MLLQGSRTPERPSQAIPVRPENPDVHREGSLLPPVAVSRRTYPPIDWSTPSLGRSVADGVGGIGKSVVLLVLLGAVFVGTAMAIAILVATVVRGLGFDLSGGY